MGSTKLTTRPLTAIAILIYKKEKSKNVYIQAIFYKIKKKKHDSAYTC
jgi:hypothetical protein